ncbi:MAG: acetyl-CoA carboxylase carboxyltransferase subunit alpha [Oscillospiraceae bacterium]|nr:acetyl-CoA carboxylase carboxyltransferase subunit alpha [Oscillospiraceae bacterium]
MNKSILYHKDRPVIDDWIDMIFEDFLELHGDRFYGDDPAIIGGLARLGNSAVTVIGTAKGRKTKESIARNFGMPHPEGYRKSLRLMKQAEKFSRPIITIVDTPGAFCGIEAEERGQGEAIARNLMEMITLKVPILTVFTGEGGSGGALALAVSDRIYMLQEAMYSVISPRGCASILWKDPSREDEAARQLKITASDLKQFGVIDEIIPEHGGVHLHPQKIAADIRHRLLSGLNWAEQTDDLVGTRYRRFRRFGEWEEVN